MVDCAARNEQYQAVDVPNLTVLQVDDNIKVGLQVFDKMQQYVQTYMA